MPRIEYDPATQPEPGEFVDCRARKVVWHPQPGSTDPVGELIKAEEAELKAEKEKIKRLTQINPLPYDPFYYDPSYME